MELMFNSIIKSNSQYPSFSSRVFAATARQRIPFSPLPIHYTHNFLFHPVRRSFITAAAVYNNDRGNNRGNNRGNRKATGRLPFSAAGFRFY